jgi:hypothetical protein
MRWWWGVAAIGVGALGGAAWQYFQARQANAPVVRHAGEGGITLSVVHDGAALRVEWDPESAQIRDAAEGTLTITDGSHVSKLPLERRELHTGAATYWPESHHVEFRLETDGGAFGEIEAPAEPRAVEAKALPKKPASKPKSKDHSKDAKAKPPARQHAHAAKSAPHSSSADRSLPDGLEWTAHPPPPKPEGRWGKLWNRLRMR